MYERIEVQPSSILELARVQLNSQALSEHTLPQSAIVGKGTETMFLVWTAARYGKDRQKPKKHGAYRFFAIDQVYNFHHLIFH